MTLIIQILEQYSEKSSAESILFQMNCLEISDAILK